MLQVYNSQLTVKKGGRYCLEKIEQLKEELKEINAQLKKTNEIEKKLREELEKLKKSNFET